MPSVSEPPNESLTRNASPRASGSLRTSMRASIADGAAFSVMVGIGEAYLPAFVLAVGLGEVFAGLTAAVPMLAGASLQLVSPRLIQFAGTHRRWVILCAFAQAACFVPLALAAARGGIPAWAVFLIATFYWAAGMATGPAWNTWMSRAIPRTLRAGFFSKRSLLAQVAVLGGLLTGGGILQWATNQDRRLSGFAILFVVACLARFISACFLKRQREPRSPIANEQRVSLIAFVRRLHKRESRLIAYMLALTVTTHLAAPYFTPYMLGELKLPYATYMMLLGTAFLAKAATMPAAGAFARRFGPKALLWIGGVGVIPLAVLWGVSPSPTYLVVLQVISGVMWGTYEFATFLLLFEMIRDEQRTSILTSYNVLNASAIATGALLGGFLLRLTGVNHYAYTVIFIISSVGRLLTIPLLLRVADMPRVPGWMWFRTLAVRPSAGAFERPIIATVEVDGEENSESDDL
ncbi:MAG: MFS transporter [Phycisphaerales bacterium]|nr:MFS transporter [Phycisphaerales bacterium]